ncbi:Elongator complex protein 4 [Liparis tanakae]|uniref:Elongator complex protein 4 n=1 Tax=Liparis tanakae TaxID=230148 RepID=A0A4Z2GNB8_9TELE|nr:Elongator complex protein 4 [Liparis tanakae]
MTTTKGIRSQVVVLREVTLLALVCPFEKHRIPERVPLSHVTDTIKTPLPVSRGSVKEMRLEMEDVDPVSQADVRGAEPRFWIALTFALHMLSGFTALGAKRARCSQAHGRRLHLPPDLSETVSRVSRGELAGGASAASACGSGGSGNKHLDF